MKKIRSIGWTFSQITQKSIKIKIINFKTLELIIPVNILNQLDYKCGAQKSEKHEGI